jgi:hypothetical protein
MINSFYTQKAETNFGFTLRANASFSQAAAPLWFEAKIYLSGVSAAEAREFPNRLSKKAKIPRVAVLPIN